MSDVDESPSESRNGPTAADASGYGLTLALVGALLLALAYYGVVAIRGPQELGQAVPQPFYFLVFAFLFVLELLQRRRLEAMVLVRAFALSAVYGGLFLFAVEGGAYLYDRPEAALDGFVGVTVFAVSLVAAALIYVGYLTLFESG